MKLFLFAVSLSLVFGAETSVKLKDLPEVVQKSIAAQTQGAQIKGISKETEKGRTTYEVETLVNGKSRDLTLDTAGALLSVEEPVAIDAVPAAVKATLDKLSAGGKIKSVESVTKGKTVSYEAVIVKGLKKSEVMVGADGAVQK